MPTPAVGVSRPSQERLTAEQASLRVREQTWGLTFEIVPGLWSAGRFEMHASAACDALGVPANLSGLRGLDVGAWDGPITFELERRGAQAHALDIQDPKRVGFDLARAIIGSRAVHYQASVYQLPFAPLEQLDLIVFRGVLYHLKYPILALERLSASLKIGGVLYFETESLLNYAEDMQGLPIELDVAALNATGVPLCLSYPNNYKASSNWFIPNPACLTGWLEVSGFQVGDLSTWEGEANGQRIYGSAVKVREPIEIEHALF